MAWIILAFILGLVIIIGTIIDGRRHGREGFMIFATILARLAALSLVPFILSIAIQTVCLLTDINKDDVVYTVSETKYISALNDSTTVSGQFYLGFGKVQEDPQYYFIEDTPAGKRMSSISAENAYLIESDEETPRIETWAAKWTNEELMFWLTLDDPSAEPIYKIYIPENSVTTDFSVDLE